MSKNVDTAKPLDCRLGDRFAAFGGRQVCLNIVHTLNGILDCARGCDNASAAGEKAF